MRIRVDEIGDCETQASMTSISGNKRDGYRAAISKRQRHEPQEQASLHLLEVTAGLVDNAGPFSTTAQATSYTRARL